MKRRKFLVGLGSIAAGGAAVMGSGAFESASLNDRDVQATVVNDNQALLRLDPTVSQHATLSGGELLVSLQDLNQNANYTFGQLIRIHNNGDDPVDISISVDSTLDSAVNAIPATGGPGVGDSPNLRSTSVTLGPGDYVDVGAEVVTTSGLGTFSTGTFTVNAD